MCDNFICFIISMKRHFAKKKEKIFTNPLLNKQGDRRKIQIFVSLEANSGQRANIFRSCTNVFDRKNHKVPFVLVSLNHSKSCLQSFRQI